MAADGHDDQYHWNTLTGSREAPQRIAAAAAVPNLLDSVPPTDSNSNQIDEEPPLVAASVQDAKPSSCLETVTEASEYHWCEDDEDLSEANRAAGQQSSCSSDHIREESITESRLLIGSDPSYVELAKQIDTDLAHIDMEDFKSEDIHTLLIDYSQNCAIPNNVADMHDSMEETPSSQDDCSLTDVSLCKSGPLFSPQRAVTGSAPPDFSTDSLNLDKDEWLDEEAAATQLLLAVDCRTNTTNYTLAWSSASGTDQDVDCNEPGSTSSGSEQSHWSSSGSGGRTAPPIPPWPAGSRPSPHPLGGATWPRGGAGGPVVPCWMPSTNVLSVNRKPSSTSHRDHAPNARPLHPKSRKDKERKTLKPSAAATTTTTTTECTDAKLICNEDKTTKSDDNPTLSDMDNGNEKTRPLKNRPVFTKNLSANKANTSEPPLSLLQIYMRQKSGQKAHPSPGARDGDADAASVSQCSFIKKSADGQEDIASGGGEGWVEEYPSSADEKLGQESVSSSLVDEDDDDDDDDDDDVSDDDEEDDDEEEEEDGLQLRSLTLTDISDIDPASIQIDALPFNTAPSCAVTSLDKLIAKIKPFELGLSPASIEEHCKFESRLLRGLPPDSVQDCAVQAGDPRAITKEEGTSTDPTPPAPVYVIFPSYSLPDLSFLGKYDYNWIGDTLLSPQDLRSAKPAASARPSARVDLSELKRRDLQHIKDWESLDLLLPEEIRQMVGDLRQDVGGKRGHKTRPKSCDSGAVLRQHKSNSSSHRSSGYRGSSTMTTWSHASSGLPTVPQSPPQSLTKTTSSTGKKGETPPPLPKRTASLPASAVKSAATADAVKSSDTKTKTGAPTNQVRFQMTRQKAKTLTEMTPSPCQSMTALRPRSCTFYEPSVRRSDAEAGATPPASPHKSFGVGHSLRKTVSFGEQLSGGNYLKMAQNSSRRPLSISHWPDGSTDIDAVGESTPTIDFEQKRGLVQGVSVAAAQLCKLMHQSLHNAEYEESTIHSKFISRTLTGSLSPALYHLLSDGLLPSVTTLFGQVTNSIWRVVEASVKKGPTLPWVEELVFCLNNEESLPEGPVRFGVFVTELVNMGGLDWWLDNLASKETILRRHYAPHGFLYLCHTSARSLMEELLASLQPLASLPLEESVPWKRKQSRVATVKTATPAAGPVANAPPPSTPMKTASPGPRSPSILKSPTRSKPQRPLSFVQNSPKRTAAPPYRRAQSQHYDSSPKKAPALPDEPVEEFSSLKKKWETICGQKKKENKDLPSAEAADHSGSPLKSRIPRPVNRLSK